MFGTFSLSLSHSLSHLSEPEGTAKSTETASTGKVGLNCVIAARASVRVDELFVPSSQCKSLLTTRSTHSTAPARSSQSDCEGWQNRLERSGSAPSSAPEALRKEMASASPLPADDDDSQEELQTVHYVSKRDLDSQFASANAGVDPHKAKQWRNAYYEFIRELGMKLNMCVCCARASAVRSSC